MKDLWATYAVRAERNERTERSRVGRNLSMGGHRHTTDAVGHQRERGGGWLGDGLAPLALRIQEAAMRSQTAGTVPAGWVGVRAAECVSAASQDSCERRNGVAAYHQLTAVPCAPSRSHSTNTCPV